MPPYLPKEFTNIPLGTLWQYLKITDELIAVASEPGEIRYWVGWHDCMASLLSDLTHSTTVKTYPALAEKFVDFRMEDNIEMMAQDFDEN